MSETRNPLSRVRPPPHPLPTPSSPRFVAQVSGRTRFVKEAEPPVHLHFGNDNIVRGTRTLELVVRNNTPIPTSVELEFAKFGVREEEQGSPRAGKGRSVYAESVLSGASVKKGRRPTLSDAHETQVFSRDLGAKVLGERDALLRQQRLLEGGLGLALTCASWSGCAPSVFTLVLNSHPSRAFAAHARTYEQ
eukprot:5382217-Pyramimonas_sp.AAC.1